MQVCEQTSPAVEFTYRDDLSIVQKSCLGRRPHSADSRVGDDGVDAAQFFAGLAHSRLHIVGV